MSDPFKYLIELMPYSIAVYEFLSLSHDFEVRFQSDIILTEQI